jgi:hypothetical protein
VCRRRVVDQRERNGKFILLIEGVAEMRRLFLSPRAPSSRYIAVIGKAQQRTSGAKAQVLNHDFTQA